MKSSQLCAPFYILLAVGFAITSLLTQAQSRCPGNIASLSPRIVAGALLVIPVKVNRAGPFDFMVDTGSQLNVIDPSLAAQLDLKSQGTVGLIAPATYTQASVAMLASLEAGSLVVTKAVAVVQDLGPIQAADPRIRGVLGENFLAHFDVLIDYTHRLLCLDESKDLQRGLHGERIPLVMPKRRVSESPFSERLVISVSLSETGNRQILLQVDSGSDGPILYSGNKDLEEPLLKHAKTRGPQVSQAQRAFAVLPPQDMRVGTRTFRKVSFVTPIITAQNIPGREEDGLLATVLFQRVFISHTDRYVILDPK